MKSSIRILSALGALALLLFNLAAQATDVASRPLNAGTLVKPNLIFGMDDSGSMDMELLFDSNNGEIWWSLDEQRGWNSAGELLYPPSGSGGGHWAEYFYLFPNAVDQSNGQRLYNDDNWSYCCYAVPPTRQFAFARSSSYNPLYYNPMVAYKPWTPAYYSGALHSFDNAVPSAAKSHPAIGSATLDLTATRCATGFNETFRLLPGMVIDKGLQTGASCASAEPADRAVTARGDLAIAYYPATYWQPQNCTVSSGDLSCAYAPDGKTLKRYEIRSGNSFPSGRSYADEMQNFANWFQYYRKRKLMLAASIGGVLENLGGMNIGVVAFNNQAVPTLYEVDARAASSNRRAVAGTFYLNNNKAGTPTRSTLNYIGGIYADANNNVIRSACQRNNAFIVTDGYADVASATPPAYNQGTWGSGAPYANTAAGTLADLALAYYSINLRPAMAAGRVPASPSDANTNLHMNTYGLTLGAKGALWPGTAMPAAASGAYAWPDPFVPYSPKAIDDLWHATINGRGQMYLASTPAETSIAIQRGLDDMLSQIGAQSSVGLSSVNLRRGDAKAYLARYNPKGWTGDLSAYAITGYSGAVGATPIWSASAQLQARDWTRRVIATHDGASGQPFAAGVASVAGLVNPAAAYGTNDDLFNYLRGKRAGEGAAWRTRYALMGAVINAQPAVSYDDGVVYQASNEGMLHAFDSGNGNELWAYVPYGVLPSIGATSGRGYRFSALLDGSPVLGSVGDRRLLVGGRGIGGSGWYALDVSNPRGITTEAQLVTRVLWEFPNGATSAAVKATVGLSVGAPRIVRLSGGGGSVALLTSGYNSAAADGKGRLFMLDASTGAVIHVFEADAGAAGVDPGLAQVSPYFEDDGSVQYVYGGDELGNVWRFDLINRSTRRLAVLKDAAGAAQPVTAAPALVFYAGKRIVFVGTGRMLGLSDLSATPGTQTLYAISDGAELPDVRASLTAQTYNTATDALSRNSVNWASGRGWYVDLPSAEVANTSPTLGMNAVVVVSNKSSISDCSASSRFYVFDMTSGSQVDGMDYVGKTISTSEMSSRMDLLRTVPVPPNCSGSDCPRASNPCGNGGVAGVTMNGSGQAVTQPLNLCKSIPSRKNSWTEIRR